MESRAIGRWTLSVLCLALALVSRPEAASAADEAQPPVIAMEVSKPPVTLVWSAVGSEFGVALGGGFVLTGQTFEPTVPVLLQFNALAFMMDEAELTAPSATATAPAITEVSLSPVSPNPNPGRATFAFALPRAAKVHLAIFDLQGRQLELLADGVFEAGPHSVAWSGARKQGGQAAGVYFVRLVTPERVIHRRMVVAY